MTQSLRTLSSGYITTAGEAESTIFTGMCHSVHGGLHVRGHACVWAAGGMHAWEGGTCMCAGQVCVVTGGVHGNGGQA